MNPDTQSLSERDMYDIMHGSILFGAGGGGQLSEGTYYLNLALKTGNFPTLKPLSSISSSTLIAGAYLLGSVSGDGKKHYTSKPPILEAMRVLNEHTKMKLGAILPIEIGASNMALALYISALSGIPVVDADPTGRSVPECTHSTFAIHDLPVGVISASTTTSESFIIQGVKNDARGEDILRAICSVSGNELSVIDHALPVETLRDSLIIGTVTNAWKLGRFWRENKDAEKIAKEGGGKLLFNGTVQKVESKEEGGFTCGHVEIVGKNKEVMTIYFKNENLYAVVGSKVVVTVPEIITVLEETTGDVVLNPNFEKGCDVIVIVLPAPEPFKTEKGLQLFGPGYCGLDIPFCSALE